VKNVKWRRGQDFEDLVEHIEDGAAGRAFSEHSNAAHIGAPERCESGRLAFGPP
jgi:hypothetical protein